MPDVKPKHTIYMGEIGEHVSMSPTLRQKKEIAKKMSRTYVQKDFRIPGTSRSSDIVAERKEHQKAGKLRSKGYEIK